MNTILQKRIEEAAKIYAESEVNRMDDSTYSMHEKKRLKMFDGYDIEEALTSFSEQILQNQWISIEEALPQCHDDDVISDVSIKVIARTSDGAIYYAYYHHYLKEWFSAETSTRIDNVTKWMFVPEEGGEK